ncbi:MULTISPECIES: hypothetical protein [unclassified Microcoleus]|uniref:hypothetical protein n=1 Tax=unclassified Microcoleus TaxID=2642155 RepID=UPI002FD779CF
MKISDRVSCILEVEPPLYLSPSLQIALEFMVLDWRSTQERFLRYYHPFSGAIITGIF